MGRPLPAYLTLLAVPMALTGCGGPAYDEEAHRAAYEAELGHEVKDWQTVHEIAQEQCDQDADAYETTVAVAQDADQVRFLELDVEYLCPDRAEDLEAALAS